MEAVDTLSIGGSDCTQNAKKNDGFPEIKITKRRMRKRKGGMGAQGSYKEKG